MQFRITDTFTKILARLILDGSSEVLIARWFIETDCTKESLLVRLAYLHPANSLENSKTGRIAKCHQASLRRSDESLQILTVH